jgi:hypothetical protein
MLQKFLDHLIEKKINVEVDMWRSTNFVFMNKFHEQIKKTSMQKNIFKMLQPLNHAIANEEAPKYFYMTGAGSKVIYTEDIHEFLVFELMKQANKRLVIFLKGL